MKKELTAKEKAFIKELFTCKARTIELKYDFCGKIRVYHFDKEDFLKSFDFKTFEKYFLRCGLIDFKFYKRKRNYEFD